MYKQVGEPAAPDADNKVVFYVDETGNPAVKYADGSTDKVLRDGDAFTTSEKPVLTYLATGYEGNDITVLIANHDDYMSGVEFGVKAQGGTAVLSGGKVVWSLPQMDVAGDVTLEVTAREFGKATSTSTATVHVDLIPFNVAGLNITAPAAGAIDVKETADVTAGTPVASDPAYNHISTSWYVSPDGTKANAVASSIDDAINLNSWTITKGMAVATEYKLWREVKMGNGTNVFNIVSDKVTFTTADSFNPWPERVDGTLDGAVQALWDYDVREMDVAQLSETEALVFVYKWATQGVILRMTKASAEANVWNFAEELIVEADGGISAPRITKIDGNTAALVYGDNTNSYKATVGIIKRTNNTSAFSVDMLPAFGTGNLTSAADIVVISELEFLVFAVDNTAGTRGLTMTPFTRNSTAESFSDQTPVVICSADTYAVSATSVADDYVQVNYVNIPGGSGDGIGHYRMLKKSGGTWSPLAEKTYKSGTNIGYNTVLSVAANPLEIAMFYEGIGLTRSYCLILGRASTDTDVWEEGTLLDLGTTNYDKADMVLVEENTLLLAANSVANIIDTYVIHKNEGAWDKGPKVPLGIGSSYFAMDRTSQNQALVCCRSTTDTFLKTQAIVAG
jgi:hypothetical protein